MNTTRTAGQVRIYTPSQQGTGSFDGGRITETKPIGFGGDGSAVNRIGPLFYWAWASSKGPATIALHPHQGFEIASYMLEGELGHFDTGGHESRVSRGGVQVMQTGSGISHREQTFDTTDFFQIWFEPDLREALKRPPTYYEASDAELPVSEKDGVHTKSILGGAAPMSLVADAQVEHLTLAPNAELEFGKDGTRTQAIVVIDGAMQIHGSDGQREVQPRDFLVVEGASDAQLKAGSTAGEALIVDVPTKVTYPLLNK